MLLVTLVSLLCILSFVAILNARKTELNAWFPLATEWQLESNLPKKKITGLISALCYCLVLLFLLSIQRRTGLHYIFIARMAITLKVLPLRLWWKPATTSDTVHYKRIIIVYFFIISGCSEAYNLSRYPQWDALNSQAAEQANSSLKNIKASLSYMNQKNFISHCKYFLWYRNMLRRKQLST